MRRWRQGKWGVVEGTGHLPRKKNIFVPKMISLGTFFRSFLSMEVSGHGQTDFTVQSRKYKNSAKIIEKFTIRPRGGGGGRTIAPHEYANKST